MSTFTSVFASVVVGHKTKKAYPTRNLVLPGVTSANPDWLRLWHNREGANSTGGVVASLRAS